MEWVLRSPQIHSTFSNLGYAHTDGYHINENCNETLEEILHNILTEDKYFRAYRRNISFGQNIKKDLIPLLINAKDDKTIELLIEIFVHLTTPIECLFNLEDISKSDFGRLTIFEINNLLTAAKTALTDHRTTKVIIEFLKKNCEWEQKTKLPVDRCRNIGNTLLFLRNIIHIPDDLNNVNSNYNGPPTHTVQNQILWNLFSQSIDKVLIKLMTIPDSGNWGVTMVQLVALLYKDQHVTTLHKLLNVWLESSLSESSEDNESNTSPPERESEDSSPMLTSDPTSDSSDTGGSGTCNDESNSANNTWAAGDTGADQHTNNATYVPPADNADKGDKSKHAKVTSKDDNSKDKESLSKNNSTHSTSRCSSTKNEMNTALTENSDCGYGTQIENQESISTSSNEDDLPFKKPVHQKPHNTKQRPNNKSRSNTTTLQEKKRKKIVKRGKSNIINVQGLTHSTPTDDDISNVLKEFTVDFLLKGFNSLVKTLHDQILSNERLEIDTSHFFWLVTYFLKFATQIELDLEHVSSVMSYEIVSYLTAEGVNICEQFELAIKLDGNDLKPCIRRQHLVVTAIREFVQAIEVYKKSVHLSAEDQQTLMELQMKMCETEELRSLLVLLLRCYNPKYHSKQYLQDLIVTNHILLIFLDGLMKLPEYKGTGSMVEHVRQFANSDMMHQYGLLLEDYEGNGEFVNDCVFTVMHHVGGELDSLISLFQPNILKTFTSIRKSEFEICDDWSDLVEYVITTFVKKPHTMQNHIPFRLDPECFEDLDGRPAPAAPPAPPAPPPAPPAPPPAPPPRDRHGVNSKSVSSKRSNKERWSADELSSLNWNFMKCKTLPDVVGGIVKLFNDDGIKKSRESIIRELLKQSSITKDVFDKLMKMEIDTHSDAHLGRKEMRDGEIRKLCDQIADDDKSPYLTWVQSVLLEICNVKIYLQKKKAEELKSETAKSPRKVQFDVEEHKRNCLPVVSPVSYHSLLFNQSVPLVPWNCSQAALCKDLRFLQLLHKLGFHMPVDTGKVFIRIPHFWTPDLLYEVAAKIAPIDTTQLKFSVNDISESSVAGSECGSSLPPDLAKDIDMTVPPDNSYRVHKRKHLASIANFTPTPGSSFNSYNNEMNKSNWLEFVQKSQEYKLNLDLHGNIIEEDGDVEMVGAGAAHLSLPTVMSAKHDVGSYIAQLDCECNNSVCESASVASDLTRMYVSDEEDKSEEAPPARVAPPPVSLHPVLTDRPPRYPPAPY